MLRKLIEKVLKNYTVAKKDNYSDNELARSIRVDLPEFLEKITENNFLYIFDGSAGRGMWANCPYVAILDKKITTSVQSGYFPVYLFREDMKGVYLSLMYGTGDFKSKYADKAKDELILHASKCRESHPTLFKNFNPDIDLATDSPNSLASFYEAGNIAAKYYNINNLPTEEELESDYWEMLNIYSEITGTKPIGIRDFIKKVLENYLAAKSNVKLAKELVTFANGGDFHKYLINIANQSDNGEYGAYGAFGAANKLIWLPYVKMNYEFASSFHVRLTFREDMKGFYLSINQAPWTMDGKLKKRGLNIQKFSKEFQNYLKEDVLEARSKLRRLTTIPEEYTEKIDLGSVMAKSGPSIEAGNVFAKYYTLDNLPPEEELVSDFKEILRIFEILEREPDINIKVPMEIIFKKLPLAKTSNENVKDHDVGRAFLEISNGIFNIASSAYPEKNYHSEAYYQSKGKWSSLPYIYVENEAFKDIYGHWDQHYVGFMFTEDLSGVYLCLNQSGAYAESYFVNNEEYAKRSVHEYLKDHAEYVRDKLKEFVSPDEFLEEPIDNVAFPDKVIYAKYYDKNDLPSNDEIISDFNELFNLYSKLKPDKDSKFKIIHGNNEILEAQKKLETILRDNATEVLKTSRKIGDLLYLSKLGIWASSGKNPNSFFNIFGIGKPVSSHNETIVEINIPSSGIDVTFSGVLAKDYLGNTFLLHRGRLHGITLNEENYDGEWVDVDDGKVNNRLILIGGFDEPDFIEKLSNFVFEVCKIKKGENCLKNGNFFDYLSERGYFFDPNIIENYLLSLKVKPFVILTGNSGTGKTKVAQLFAQYLRDENDTLLVINEELAEKFLTKKEANKYLSTIMNSLGTYPNDQVRDLLPDLIEKGIIGVSAFKDKIRYEIVPVGANWTENRHIIGFYNVITEKYQRTEALNLILSAREDVDEPYFLILDEMNLSHVERYFSDFLSAMESEEKIELHQALVDITTNEDNLLPPEKIDLSQNLMVIGTVNVDETTYMFSPKVLDRANTLEFVTQPAEDYMSGSPEYSVEGNIDYLQDPLSDVDTANKINIRTENIIQLKNRLKGVKTASGEDLWDLLSKNIGKFQEILKKADFDFGFRTINEIIRFMCVAWQYENRPPKWDNWQRYFDAQIMQKMLPKLHGSQKELGKVLEELEQECAKGNFPTSTEKIKRMSKTLKEKRYVSFTG